MPAPPADPTEPSGPAARYEVLVAGGGPAGCAAALTLARAGRSVLLADAGTGPAKTGESLASVAAVLLDDLGIGQQVLGSGHLPCYGRLSAWGSPELRSVHSIRDPYGPGRLLDRALFDRRLRAAAGAAGADLAEHTAVRPPLRAPAGGWSVELRGPAGRRTVRCDWLVDATGRAAALATRCGARRRTLDRLTATHLTLGPAPDAVDGCSLVESDPDGWWYTALLPSRHRLVAWFTDADLPAAAPSDAGRFRQRILRTRHIRARVEPHPADPGLAPRRAPAHSAHLDRPWGDGWVAAGDAAAAFDPLSAQGVLTALVTGLNAGEALDARLRGHRSALEEYGHGVRAVWAGYLREHRSVHRQEDRWAGHPFWDRRTAGPPPDQAPHPHPHPHPSGAFTGTTR
ncbi:FAD-dependent monooxygenase [Kitasatospora sp. NBC_00240]|uniref:NAD(P)/FAD-dependent oxidoreductase n=1 Tax=Kitasatospora sp. NBC_00240 TaxID=2903567 RepID=UPI00225AA245|nr:FAD-dependent monooxygenase [Kitasatospora sp. NBC_00240]MCX5208752.1 FAD-dependent monooxygenase [Kitasatospora sp. NBC_00240]